MVQMNKQLKKSAIALSIGLGMFVGTSTQVAQATGLVAGATEFTQISNNGLLALQLPQQITTAAASVASKITLAQQYLTMLQNIKNLPQDMLKELAAPYKNQIKALLELQTSIKDLKTSADNTKAMFGMRGQDWASSGKTLTDYLKYEVALADKKGGIYKKKLDQDIAAMDDMKEKATALRKTAEKTSNITGTVQGLQALTQLSGMAAGELMEIKGVLLAQSADRNQSKMETEEGKKLTAQYRQQMVETIKNQKAEADKIQFTFPDVNKSWPGIETQ